MELVELDDRWLLPYRGMQVIQIRVSYQLTLDLDSGAQVDLETEAVLSSGSLRAPDVARTPLTPQRQDVAPALALFGATILSAVVFKSGVLRLVFHTGAHLNAKPDPQYEAWSVSGSGPDSLRLVCQPGGGVAVGQ
ncbi:hypothetical protein Pth03_82140 [Planotetraspora thailandica]|uniref:Uncharacterized protein n=1 Tax=Planotetraspora thailandica TaxID=487172 RepID=A0A8J3Y2P5_9ACTN|nr:DUF6188 family protein [Planotetraspora thailandica]GII59825.1 hypothetical protein Pth03_82140 [Planotetraspora thailandica]